jgi:hypothetical protein
VAKKTIDPATRARWAEEERQFREYVERRLARERAQFEARERAGGFSAACRLAS